MEQQLTFRKRLKKEMKKVVVITNVKEIIQKLLELMKKHIGVEKRISKMELFKEVYGIYPEDVTELQEWIMWEMLKRAMHRMRQRTKCFIVSKLFPVSQYSARNQGIWCFWVAQTMEDFWTYRNNLERNIARMRAMEKKAEKAVKEKWYQEEWKYD